MTVLAGQARFHAANDEAVLAQQNLRALTEVMASEIRTASPHDVMRAGPDSLVLRADVTRAVVCDGSAAGRVDLFVFDSVATANLRPAFRGTAIAGPYAGRFAYADAFVPVAVPAAAAESGCRARGADPAGAAPASAFRRIASWTGPLAPPTAPGTVVRIYGELQYAFAPSTTDRGASAVRRNGQELVTPLGAGARFDYVLSDGTLVSRVPRTRLADIRIVRVTAAAAGRGRPGWTRGFTFDVALQS